MRKKPITKAVIAAAGFGTRFLPQTKAMPKEMLPIVDKPIIQYVVEELTSAGITDIVIVTGYHKRSIEDHFDQISGDLFNNLKQNSKTELMEKTAAISDLANFAYIRQKSPYGNAGPLLDAAHLIGDEPFIYTYADDFILASPSRFSQLIDAYSKVDGSVISCVIHDSDDDYRRYGYVDGVKKASGLIDIQTIVEKPGSRSASPSNIASVSGYLFEPVIIDYIKQQFASINKATEFRIQDAMQQMIKAGNHIYAQVFESGKYYDTGNPLDYLKTTIDLALLRQDIGQELKKYLQSKLD